jgi:hypothetical protein
MSIGLCHSWRRMAEKGLHVIQGYTFRHEHTGESVPERMKVKFRIEPGSYYGFLQLRAKEIAIGSSTPPAREDISRTALVLRKELSDSRVSRNYPGLASLCPIRFTASDRNGSTLQINIAPFQITYFGPAQSGHCGEQNDIVKWTCVNMLQQFE